MNSAFHLALLERVGTWNSRNTIDRLQRNMITGYAPVSKLMKTAFELAMERLAKDAPAKKLTDEQKKELAELDSRCAAKIAERELLLKGEMAKAMERADGEALEQLEKQLSSDRKTLKAELEEKKQAVRERK